MKLRLFVVAMLLANLLFATWHMGWLDALFGASVRTDRDPERVLQQVNPQAITVTKGTSEAASPRGGTGSSRSGGSTAGNTSNVGPINASSTSSTSSAASAPALSASSIGSTAVAAVAAAISAATGGGNKPAPATAAATGACLEAGPFTTAQIDTAESSMASLPAGAWKRVDVTIPATFGVLMGPFKTREALRDKVTELERAKLPFERVPMALEDGSPMPSAPTLLVLQQTDSRDSATTALATWTTRGVRTARVAQLNPGGARFRLRVESASEAQLTLLRASGSGVDGRPFAACPT
jgi:hypothetical protein